MEHITICLIICALCCLDLAVQWWRKRRRLYDD